jgi:hypothetical protein
MRHGRGGSGEPSAVRALQGCAIDGMADVLRPSMTGSITSTWPPRARSRRHAGQPRFPHPGVSVPDETQTCTGLMLSSSK